MTEKTITFLTPKHLRGAISWIEKVFPGYWYSVSQTPNNIRVSLGPSQYCLLDTDRLWAETRDGDNGRIIDITPQGDMEFFSLIPYLEPVLIEISNIRVSLIEKLTEKRPVFAGPHRKQSRDDLEKFKKRYARFLREFEDFKKLGLNVQELYVGSCQLSVDCSIRGIDRHGKGFDFSADLIEDAILMEALDEAVILTIPS